jgi:hypothetical protein
VQQLATRRGDWTGTTAMAGCGGPGFSVARHGHTWQSAAGGIALQQMIGAWKQMACSNWWARGSVRREASGVSLSSGRRRDAGANHGGGSSRWSRGAM